jgi:protein phosphatase
MRKEVRHQGSSNVGLVRTNNEDRYIVLPDRCIFAVCDGLGGHAAGEVASRIAAESLEKRISCSDEEPRQLLADALQEANSLIISDQRDNPEHVGMGTTVSLLWLPSPSKAEGWIGHVGDSRVYRFRESVLVQLTEDHSPIFRLYKEGSLKKDDLRYHPQKNLIERSLGLSPIVEADIFSVEVESGDLFLLCTDGLTDLVSDETITEVCTTTPWDDICEVLIGEALELGGYDNVTVVAAQVIDSES